MVERVPGDLVAGAVSFLAGPGETADVPSRLVLT